MTEDIPTYYVEQVIFTLIQEEPFRIIKSYNDYYIAEADKKKVEGLKPDRKFNIVSNSTLYQI